mmetsp:Transcript_72722/g.161617  ORF Transcript_72722/g.161617 Transcript_72722/m.161617 type:complete len:201 (+) Transcript_72722:114-716(+)
MLNDTPVYCTADHFTTEAVCGGETVVQTFSCTVVWYSPKMVTGHAQAILQQSLDCPHCGAKTSQVGKLVSEASIVLFKVLRRELKHTRKPQQLCSFVGLGRGARIEYRVIRARLQCSNCTAIESGRQLRAQSVEADDMIAAQRRQTCSPEEKERLRPRVVPDAGANLWARCEIVNPRPCVTHHAKHSEELAVTVRLIDKR